MGRALWIICGVALAVAVSGQPSDAIGQSERVREAATSDRENTVSETGSSAATTVEDGFDRIAIALEAQGNNPEAQRQAEDDLRAQQDMAKWAFWMFVAAAVTVVIGVSGLFLIWRTLVHTRTASVATGKMLDLAQKTARDQLRAYLHVQPLKAVWFGDGGPCFHIPVENTGQTPVVRFSLRYSDIRLMRMEDLADVQVPPNEELWFNQWSAVGANRKRNNAAYPGNRGEIDVTQFFATPGLCAVVVGRVTYVDIFGDEWFTDFVSYFRSDWGPERPKMAFIGTDVAAYQAVKKASD